MPTLPPRPGGKNPLAARVVLDDQSGLDITEAGTKKSLAIYLVRDPQDVPGIASLGPDPLTDDFTLEKFRDILEAEGRKQIKGVLRHQGTIAGIGNAYSDEILHAARMSPFKPARRACSRATTTPTSWSCTTPSGSPSATLSSGPAGWPPASSRARRSPTSRCTAAPAKPCPVCGDTVREVSFADSSLQYCPTCQTGGKPLADRRMSKLLK